ncbi:hypothetical protein BDY21DRAFT_363451 [Lineolata rhizophorae]|uniref:Uncharacterized protein n=1 Tax=Lineolata rhizophorae TaxID=578093 RepID=A0A6A6P1H4_9PEZI|nr:hypothetical protein BDY21DRAFT_363451 [Lineolata rhizophorae]
MPPGKNFTPLTLEPVNFSLTAGTDIPPPQESPPRPPTPGRGPLSSHPTTPVEGSSGSSQAAALASPSSSAAAAAAPPPPASSRAGRPSDASAGGGGATKRPSSVRKFLGLRSLNVTSPRSHEHANHDSAGAMSPPPAPPAGRPGSPNTVSTVQTAATGTTATGGGGGSLKHKKSAGWFGRRASTMFLHSRALEDADVKENGAGGAGAGGEPQRKGPPPPTLPELGSLAKGGDGGSLGGGDLFKDIK